MKIFELPSEYREIKKMDLQKNTKLAVFVNVLALVIAAVVFWIGLLLKPTTLDSENPFKTLMSTVVVFVLVIVYMVLHELVHGIFFKKYSGEKAKYGVTGLYAFAKSDAYYNKKEVNIIELSPIVILGVILVVLNVIFSTTLFWYVFIIQIINISSAVGDLYFACVLRKMPDDILIKDDGVSMTIYGK